ncbi:MAG: 30S ribosomal protein S16, partial [Actinomycetota bacterium]|nr:30S ribosomal protein S16 [Actinomycetota bacterium]
MKLRLMRMGKKKQPTYRVVAADSRKARNGRIIEAVGFYDPRRDPSVIEIDNEKAVGWLRNGAQPTERVEKLLKITGAWDDFKGQPAGTSATPPPAPKAKAETPAPSPAKDEAEASAEEAPVEEASAEEAPVEEASVEEASVEEASVEEASAEEASVEEASAEEASVEEASAEEASA